METLNILCVVALVSLIVWQSFRIARLTRDLAALRAEHKRWTDRAPNGRFVKREVGRG